MLLAIIAIVIFIGSGCSQSSSDTEEITIEKEMELEMKEPDSGICHEPEEVIAFLNDVSCSMLSPQKSFPTEDCEGERLTRMIQAPVIRIAPLHMRDRDREIISEVVDLLNEGMPEEYKITIGPDLTTPHAETREDWQNSIDDTAPGEIHLSVGNLQPNYASSPRAGEADFIHGEDENGRKYNERGIVRMNITNRIASPELDALHQYDCDRYNGQVWAHEILHVLGFYHVSNSWNHTATATMVDRIPAVTVMTISNTWCANEDNPNYLRFAHFYDPLEYVGSLDIAALRALYGMDTESYAEEAVSECP